MKTLIFAIAQLNFTVGDIIGNTRKLKDAYHAAKAQGADIVVAPEMYLSGYQLDDLVQVEGFLEDMAKAVDILAALTKGDAPALIVGAPRRDGDGLIRNSVYVLDGGEILAVRDKVRLPHVGVFDDPRNFIPGALPGPVLLRDVLIGLPVCEDLWHADLIECLEETGAEMLISCNGSPFEEDKVDDRMMTSVARVTETGLPLLYVNLVGGHDDLVFDGSSFAVNPGGQIGAHLPSFSESVAIIEAKKKKEGWRFQGTVIEPDKDNMAIWRGITLGIRDYVEKTGFNRVVLGLSGGIDSALVATLAVDALGAGRVDAVMMPSPHTSQISRDDAQTLADNLGIPLRHLDITQTMESIDILLGDVFTEAPPDLARENLQSRLRGLALMSISNTTGQMLLTTGNKSEYATGYATLYGDMCGGYAPLIDVWKTRVFALSRWRNENLPKGALGAERGGDGGPLIPERIITRPPSAELRPGQQDSDSLPDYEILDTIMQGFVENHYSPNRLIADGFAPDLVHHCAAMLRRSEYKRRQCAPGPKLTKRAFYRDRRFPIINGFPSDKPLSAGDF